MPVYIDFDWLYFCIFFGAALLISVVLSIKSSNFYTMHVVIRKFSIIDLEFPASAMELAIFIKGIFLLPASLSKKSLHALRNQLYLDFLFIPSAYGSIFIICMKVSMKMVSFGHGLFGILAWVQLIPMLCDIIENFYLLNKIRPEPAISKPSVHNAYKILEFCKWGIALTAAVCSLAAIFYFWLVGMYSDNSLYFLMIIVAEIIIYFILRKVTSKSEKEMMAKIQQTEIV